MRRYVIAYIDRFFPKPAAELRNVCHGNVVESPKGIFIKRRVPLFEADFYAIGQEIVLTD